MYCILSRPKAVCASGRYNESQTTASGSLTSLVLPLPHEPEVQTEPQHGGELVAWDCLTATRVVENAATYTRCRGTTATSPRHGGGCRGMRLPRHRHCCGTRDTDTQRAAGYISSRLHRCLTRQPPPCRGLTAVVPRQRAAGRQSRATIPFSSMSWFSLDFRESKPKFLSTNSFSWPR